MTPATASAPSSTTVHSTMLRVRERTFFWGAVSAGSGGVSAADGVSEGIEAREGPESDEGTSDDAGLLDGPDVATVGRVVAVVTHDEDLVVGDHAWIGRCAA